MLFNTIGTRWKYPLSNLVTPLVVTKKTVFNTPTCKRTYSILSLDMTECKTKCYMYYQNDIQT